MGGVHPFPTYQNYTAGDNYSETLRLEYDPAKTNYSDLLEAYWKYAPDPTIPCDDPAYCLRIFTVTEEQRMLAIASAEAKSKEIGQPINFNVWNASDWTFWKAEEYHQKYFQKMGETCGTGANIFARTRKGGK